MGQRSEVVSDKQLGMGMFILAFNNSLVISRQSLFFKGIGKKHEYQQNLTDLQEVTHTPCHRRLYQTHMVIKFKNCNECIVRHSSNIHLITTLTRRSLISTVSIISHNHKQQITAQYPFHIVSNWCHYGVLIVQQCHAFGCSLLYPSSHVKENQYLVSEYCQTYHNKCSVTIFIFYCFFSINFWKFYYK